MTDRYPTYSTDPDADMADPWGLYLDGDVTFEQLPPDLQERARRRGLA
jgi:hypothetical protein